MIISEATRLFYQVNRRLALLPSSRLVLPVPAPSLLNAHTPRFACSFASHPFKSLQTYLKPKTFNWNALHSCAVAQSFPKATSNEPRKVTKELLQKYQQLVPSKEDIYTVPNMLTLSRIFMTPLIGYCIVHQHYYLALATFAYAGISDLLDGYIARRFNQKTMLGTMLDPLADKILMTTLTVSLSMADLLPTEIFYSNRLYISQRYLSVYFDPSLPSVQMKPTTISKFNTFFQLVLMGASLASPVFGWEGSSWLTGFQWFVAGTTLWSGVSYVVAKDAVKLLKIKN